MSKYISKIQLEEEGYLIMDKEIREISEQHFYDTSNPHSVTRSQIGLSNVENPRSTDKVWRISDVGYIYLFATDDISESPGIGTRLALDTSHVFTTNTLYFPSGKGECQIKFVYPYLGYL